MFEGLKDRLISGNSKAVSTPEPRERGFNEGEKILINVLKIIQKLKINQNMSAISNLY